MKQIDNIKSYIYIAVFVAGLFATWYNFKTEVELIKVKVEKNSKELEANNLELINYKLDEILKALSE